MMQVAYHCERCGICVLCNGGHCGVLFGDRTERASQLLAKRMADTPS